MQPTPTDALIKSERIYSLASLYDRFAHALDPFSSDRDTAEEAFFNEVTAMYESIAEPKPTLHEFTKAVIVRCKKHIKATYKVSTQLPEPPQSPSTNRLP